MRMQMHFAKGLRLQLVIRSIINRRRRILLVIVLTEKIQDNDDDHNSPWNSNKVDKLVPHSAGCAATVDVSIFLGVARYRVVLA